MDEVAAAALAEVAAEIAAEVEAEAAAAVGVNALRRPSMIESLGNWVSGMLGGEETPSATPPAPPPPPLPQGESHANIRVEFTGSI